MFTLEQAKAAALEYMGLDMEIATVGETAERWIFGFRNANTGEAPDLPPVSVNKADGVVADFFPPDHMEEFLSMKHIEGEWDEE